jgi:hypothetical protein
MTSKYYPEPVPFTDDLPYIREFLGREFSRILAAFEGVTEIELEALALEPVAREGMIKYADGTNWDPGAGEGIYAYVSGAWRKLDTLSALGLMTAQFLRLTSNGDVTLSSTNHAFQIGDDAGANMRIDTNEIQFMNNGAAVGGNLQILGGNLVIGDSASIVQFNGGKLQFPATQNPSTNANTLDDYEEGTWTPTLAFGGASTGITYNTQQGTYVKIGRVVTFQFRLIISSKGSATGNAAILGLPFASDNYHPVTFGYGTNFTGLTGTVTGYMENNSANITLRQSAATGTGPILTDAVFTATTDMIISGSYIAIE